MEIRASNLPDDKTLVRARLKTPKAAAVAGIVFAVLMIVILWLLRRSIPADPLESGVWLTTSTKPVMLALNLIPFAGVAFLWFIGVLRDRLGAQEDRFFSTVFLGSSLLFLASIFTAASLAGAITLVGSSHGSDILINTEAYYIIRVSNLHYIQRLLFKDGCSIYDIDINYNNIYVNNTEMDSVHWIYAGISSY